MPDYNQSIIYKIICKDTNINDLYIGSTTNYHSRKRQHKFCCNTPESKKYNYKVYKFIRENGGWNNWEMIPLEIVTCNNKMELNIKEYEFINTYKATLNTHLNITNTDNANCKKSVIVDENTTAKTDNNTDYYIKNRDKILAQKKLYYQNNKEKRKEYLLKIKNNKSKI